MNWVLTCLLFLLFQPLFSQTALERVIQQTNVAKLRTLSTQYEKESTYKRQKAYQFAKDKNIPVSIDLKDGTYASLVEIDTFGFPKYFQTHNLSAAISTNTHLVLDSALVGYQLGGENMIIGEWDAGGILLSHKELFGRVTQLDQPDTTHDHAQHVAGTMMATGINQHQKEWPQSTPLGT